MAVPRPWIYWSQMLVVLQCYSLYKLATYIHRMIVYLTVRALLYIMYVTTIHVQHVHKPDETVN